MFYVHEERSGFSPPKMKDSGKRPHHGDSPDSLDAILGASHAKSTRTVKPVMYAKPSHDDVASFPSPAQSSEDDLVVLEMEISTEELKAQAKIQKALEEAKKAEDEANAKASSRAGTLKVM